jgi:hypothetical protein
MLRQPARNDRRETLEESQTGRSSGDAPLGERRPLPAWKTTKLRKWPTAQWDRRTNSGDTARWYELQARGEFHERKLI